MKRFLTALLLTACTIFGATAAFLPNTLVHPVTPGSAGILPAPPATSFNPLTYQGDPTPTPTRTAFFAPMPQRVHLKIACQDDEHPPMGQRAHLKIAWHKVLGHRNLHSPWPVGPFKSPHSLAANDHRAVTPYYYHPPANDPYQPAIIVVIKHSDHAKCPPTIIILIFYDPVNNWTG